MQLLRRHIRDKRTMLLRLHARDLRTRSIRFAERGILTPLSSETSGFFPLDRVRERELDVSALEM